MKISVLNELIQVIDHQIYNFQSTFAYIRGISIRYAMIYFFYKRDFL